MRLTGSPSKEPAYMLFMYTGFLIPILLTPVPDSTFCLSVFYILILYTLAFNCSDILIF